MRKLWIVCMAASLCMGGCAGQNTDGQDEVDTTSVSFMAEETAEYIEQGGIVIEEGFRSNEESATEETGQTQENLLQEEADIPQEAEISNNTAEETESAAQEVSPEPLKGETIHYGPDSPELTGPYLTEPIMHPQSPYTRIRWFTDEECQAQIQFPFVLTDEIRKTGITLYPVFLP